MMNNFIQPNWQAPTCVKAFMTTRTGGVSTGAYGQCEGDNGLNLATHVGDELAHVLTNRAALKLQTNLPNEPLWLNQTHSTIVHLQTDAGEYDVSAPPPEADAVVVTARGQVGVVMTADCLPVLFASQDGSIVGAAHAGWRGLLDGVLEATIKVMIDQGAQVDSINAWFGAAIGKTAFEVGQDVFNAFINQTPETTGNVHQHFTAHPTQPNKYFADIYGLARDRLYAVGVINISGGEHCTVSDAQNFYSYRRDGITGRMASLIWIE